MTKSQSNRGGQIAVVCFGLVLCAIIVWLSVGFGLIRLDLAITLVGSLLSFTGIILTLMQVYGVRKSTEAINEAVAENAKAIDRISHVYDISRHTQMISELHSYLTSGKWELAHLRLVEINLIVSDIKDNYEQFNIDIKDINRLLSWIAEDLRSLNDAIHKSGVVEALTIVNHLEELSPFLNKICNKIKKQNYDN